MNKSYIFSLMKGCLSVGFLGLLMFLLPQNAQAKVSVTDLRCEHLVNPMSIGTPTPRLGWRLESDKKDVMQTAYRILVSSSREKAERLEGDLWDVHRDGEQSQWIVYAGKTLQSDTRCYWRVQVNTNRGKSEWSDIATWNVALLYESDWRGQWIGLDQAMPWDREDLHSELSARYVHHQFSCQKTVAQATLYISGLGLYEARINGKNVTDRVLTPAPTDYRCTVLYNAYDVTTLLDEQNSIDVTLGNGRYYTMQQKTKPYKIANFGYPKLRLNLIIRYSDGTKQVVATDAKWLLCPDGPIRSNNEYDGEIYDARKVCHFETNAPDEKNNVFSAQRVAIPLGTLRPEMTAGMKVIREVAPIELKKTPRGSTIIDFGENMAGWVRLRIHAAKAGDSILIRYAERLDSLGNLYRDNLRTALSRDIYIANGQENDTWWSPTFSWHGFRYAEVEGLKRADIKDFTAQLISDDMEITGHFHARDTIINKVYQNAVRGIQANYKGMPIDCPQRNERQPWLGDRTRGCYGEAFALDNHNLYAKWIRDIAEAQREDGCIPDIAPAFWNYYSDNVTWPAALPFALEMMLNHYADTAIVKQYTPNVERWLTHLKRKYSRDGLITKDKYGDWCVPPEKPELIHSQDETRKTDGALMSTAYYYRILRLMERFCQICGDNEKAFAYQQEAEETKAAFNKKFLTRKENTSALPGHISFPDSTYYGNNSLTSNLLPYAFGMIDDPYVKGEVEKNIIKATSNGHVACGVIGIGWIMHALTDMHRSDIAWLIANTKTYPSWGYMTEKGATTIWELWNGDTADPSMNSGNHVMLLGDLLSWMFEDMAGIRSNDGFKNIQLAPDFSVDEINHICAAYHSLYGDIVSQWEKQNGRLQWHVEIPANTRATLTLPDGSQRQMGSGSYDIDEKLPIISTNNSWYKTTDATKEEIAKHVVVNEFLYESAPFPQCHASSIAETSDGDLVCTYFGGTHENHSDVCIWASRKPKGAKEWSEPILVADGVFSDIAPDYREACWNPVIYQVPGGELRIYFKIGKNVASWKGYLSRSYDGGKTWTPREALSAYVNDADMQESQPPYGPIKNKPILSKGRLISPTSDERNGWKAYFEYSDDMGKTWKRTNYVKTAEGMRVIQPSIIQLSDGRLEALCRTRSRFIGVTTSDDNGETWSDLQLIDTPNNNSGLDAVTLKDGTFVMACNDHPIEENKSKGPRTPLSLLRSTDGIHWTHWITLEDSPIGQYSYPSIIQTRDGHLHIVYTWRRLRVKHVEIKP